MRVSVPERPSVAVRHASSARSSEAAASPSRASRSTAATCSSIVVTAVSVAAAAARGEPPHRGQPPVHHRRLATPVVDGGGRRTGVDCPHPGGDPGEAHHDTQDVHRRAGGRRPIGAGFGLWQTRTTEAQGRPDFELPPAAVQVAPGVFFLGTAIHDGRLVEGFALAGHKPKHNPGGPNGDEPPDEEPPPAVDPATCYSFIWSDGANWAAAEPYLINPANNSGVSTDAVAANLATALGTWDTEVATSIFGGQVAGTIDGADGNSPDGKNEAYFARIVGRGAGGTIAFTIVWRLVDGPLIEWDMVFNTKYDWSLSGESGKMDFLNIAAHEVGHAAGMGHTDTNVGCVDQTMYPTASKGETIKRDLDVGDQAGIAALY